MLTPYKISKQEFTKHEELAKHIDWVDDEDKSKGIDFYNSPFVITYPAQIVDEMSKGLYKIAKDIKIELDEYTSVDILKLFRIVVENALKNFNLIIYEEMDFFELQGQMVKKAVGLVIDERRFTKFDVLIAFMLLSAKNESVITIGASANRIPPLPKVEQNEASFLSGVLEPFDSLVDYQDTGVKSNQNIRRLNIISLTNPNFPVSMLRERMIRGTEDKTIFFSAKKWDKTSKVAARYKNAWIYGLSKNLDERVYDEENNTFSIGVLEGYERLVLTDQVEDNISNKTFKTGDVALINLSSSRAVSITTIFDDISNSVAFSDKVNSGVTQSWGRFRYTEVDLYLVGIDLDKETVMSELQHTDTYLYEAIKEVKVYKINGTGMYSRVKDTLKISSRGKRVGKAVGKNTKDKRQSAEEFLKIHPKGGFIAYKKWCEENNKKTIGKTVFFKLKNELGETNE